MSFIGDFIIGFFEGAIASSTTLQRIFLWILFLYIRSSHARPRHDG